MSTFLAAAASKGSPNFILLLLPIGIYFGMYRPRKKQMQRQQEATNSIVVGSDIVLTSGIFGTVRSMGEQSAEIEIAPGVTIHVDRRAVARIATKPSEQVPTIPSQPPTEASA